MTPSATQESRIVAVAFMSGVATFGYVPRMINQVPTPWVGTVERIHLYGFWLWIGVLAVALLARRHGGSRGVAVGTGLGMLGVILSIAGAIRASAMQAAVSRLSADSGRDRARR